MEFKQDTIHIFTDGACRNNQSTDKTITVGAFGYVLHFNGKEKEYAEAERNTTSNRQELYGLINALLVLKRRDRPIIIYPDSRYVMDGATIWIKNWKKNDWKTADKKDVANQDLWKWLDELLSEFPDIRFVKVKGHSNDEYNNRVDKMCQDAIKEFENRVFGETHT